MARRLRIEYEGATYHTVSRGTKRQDILLDATDRQHLLTGIESVVDKFGWEMFVVVLMNNHFHLLFRTPQPNLSHGMQCLLTGYATWWNQRHRRVGHVFQGRFNAQLVQDETYFWEVSRYIHLNPVRARLADYPEQWRWSSYPGYHRATGRWPWVAYDKLLHARQGAVDGADPRRAYRKFVLAGVKDPPSAPLQSAHQGWLIGTDAFADRLRAQMAGKSVAATAAETSQRVRRTLDEIIAAVLEHFAASRAELSRRGSRHPARPVLAWLARRYTTATLQQLADVLGLSRRDSVPNLTRRVERQSPKSSHLKRDVAAVEVMLDKNRGFLLAGARTLFGRLSGTTTRRFADPETHSR